MSFTARLREKLPRFMAGSGLVRWPMLAQVREGSGLKPLLQFQRRQPGPPAVTSGTAGPFPVCYGSGTHHRGFRMRHAALFVAVCLAFAPAAHSAESAKPVPAAELARSIDIP